MADTRDVPEGVRERAEKLNTALAVTPTYHAQGVPLVTILWFGFKSALVARQRAADIALEALNNQAKIVYLAVPPE